MNLKMKMLLQSNLVAHKQMNEHKKNCVLIRSRRKIQGMNGKMKNINNNEQQ